jgi:hypothetical protein
MFFSLQTFARFKPTRLAASTPFMLLISSGKPAESVEADANVIPLASDMT